MGVPGVRRGALGVLRAVHHSAVTADPRGALPRRQAYTCGHVAWSLSLLAAHTLVGLEVDGFGVQLHRHGWAGWGAVGAQQSCGDVRWLSLEHTQPGTLSL